MLYCAERLKTRWLEERTGQRVDPDRAAGGAALCPRESERRMEDEEEEEEKATGEHPSS